MMLPGRDMQQKKELARKLRELVAGELGVDSLMVSVSVEDIPIGKWVEAMDRIPDDSILIPETERDGYPWAGCC